MPLAQKTKTQVNSLKKDRFFFRAIRLGDGLDLAGIAEIMGLGAPSAHAFAVYHRVKDNTFIYILNYGVVVFCNAEDELVEGCLDRWKDFIIAPGSRIEDDLLATKTESDHIEVTFDGLQLGRFDDAVNKMIMLHLAQSVVLDHFFDRSQTLLTSIKEHTEYMEEKGKIRLSQKDTLRFIGKILSAKNHIAENLYIMDSPEQTWDDEYLEVLHGKLRNHLDQAQRYRVIENTLRIVEENLTIYTSYNDHRESSRLEWIIIILIVIEVVDTFVSKLIW
jgi:uncharacterized Rmd1/YagE family protein